MRLYCVRVEIREAASNYAYPLVVHEFYGPDKASAWQVHHSHRSADAFLRGCEDHGLVAGTVTCRATVSEGWVDR